MKILINFVKKAFYFTLLIQAFFGFNAYYRTGKIDQISLFFNVDHILFSIKVFFIYFYTLFFISFITLLKIVLINFKCKVLIDIQ